jgi:hypothetical protein
MTFHQPDHAVPAQALNTLMHIGGPAFLGFHDARIQPFHWSWPGGIFPALLCALALLGVGASVAAWRVAQGPEGRLAILSFPLSFLLMALIFIFTRFGFEFECRYLLSLWVSLGGIYALGCWQLSRWNLSGGIAACVLLIAYQGYQTFGIEKPMYVSAWNPKAPLNYDFGPLAQRLDAMGKHHLIVDYWTAMPLTFDGDERVIAVDRSWIRNPEMVKEVMTDPNACLLATPGHEPDQYVQRLGWKRTEFKDVPGLAETQVLACPN